MQMNSEWDLCGLDINFVANSQTALQSASVVTGAFKNAVILIHRREEFIMTLMNHHLVKNSNLSLRKARALWRLKSLSVGRSPQNV
jgi:hypothetical protein